MSADASVMEYLLPLPSRDASDAWINCQLAHLAEHGFCFWAVETREGGAFVGAVGLLRVSYDAHFTPAVEVGWRIARAFWGLGYAPEAANAAIRFGFETLQLPEIVANTVPNNQKSRRVMEKVAMSYNPNDDFNHPHVPEEHPLQYQVLYRLSRARWLSLTASSDI